MCCIIQDISNPSTTYSVSLIDCCTLKLSNGDITLLQTFNLETTDYEIANGKLYIKDGVNVRQFDVATAPSVFGFATIADVLTFLDASITSCRCGDVVSPTIPEQLFPFNMDIVNGQSLTLADVMAAASAASGLSGIGVAGFDFDLKSLNGEAVTGLLATASDATSTGPHGSRNLDGGGSFQLGVVETNKNIPTYRRLNLAQTFTAAPNSVTVILIEMIY